MDILIDLAVVFVKEIIICSGIRWSINHTESLQRPIYITIYGGGFSKGSGTCLGGSSGFVFELVWVVVLEPSIWWWWCSLKWLHKEFLFSTILIAQAKYVASPFLHFLSSVEFDH
ncbi:hypothetical protein MKX03_026361 [Papaver bracteatum]|nr:hypothetical protein MKX03_026361 [Papaver bracteatum]